LLPSSKRSHLRLERVKAIRTTWLPTDLRSNGATQHPSPTSKAGLSSRSSATSFPAGIVDPSRIALWFTRATRLAISIGHTPQLSNGHSNPSLTSRTHARPLVDSSAPRILTPPGTQNETRPCTDQTISTYYTSRVPLCMLPVQAAQTQA
jgi:hypothetical protein